MSPMSRKASLHGGWSNKMKKTFFLVFCLVVWGGAAAYGATQTVSVTDMGSREVTAPFDPERIICIGPGTLRLIVYLQAEDKIVGVEDMEKMHSGGRPYWMAHPELAKLPRCGPGGPACINKKPDLETVLSLRPQVIFTTYMDAGLADDVQGTLDIPVVVLSYGQSGGFDEAVYNALRIVGRILNREDRADRVIGYIDALRKDMHQRTMDVPETEKPAVYIGGVGYYGAYGLESTERQFIPFEWIHADNIASRISSGKGSHLFIGKETLLRLDPDIIFIDGSGLALMMADYRKHPEVYSALRAFAGGRVYALHPFNWYTTNIGTALVDAYAIASILYRERFSDVDLEKKANDIYTFLVGKPVYHEMEKEYGPVGQKVRLAD